MPDLTEGQTELAVDLFEAGAVKLAGEDEEGFRLKAHQDNPDLPLSPFFLQLRTPDNTTHGDGPLVPEIVERIGIEMYEIIERSDVHYDHVAGIPNAGVPFSEAFAAVGRERRGAVSELTLHKEGDLTTRRITEQVEGDFAPGDTVLLIDDLVTHANTKLEAIAALRANGLNVEFLVVLVDREQGGPEELRENGVETVSVMTFSQMLELYADEGMITDATLRRIRDYLES